MNGQNCTESEVLYSTHSHDDSYMYGSRVELLRISTTTTTARFIRLTPGIRPYARCQGVGRDRRRRKKNCYFLLVSSDAGANDGAGLIDL